ncbi:hypothetical protein ABT354_04615 [Streptomyces sp. NPDC000594]|uniref:hypothetical protein n=1 Tax=Streptomyces sp. NPDC000594 TaxID=3154261 RepID=UPI0033312EF0
MRHRTRHGAAAVLTVSALLLTAAGCGSGDDSGDDSGDGSGDGGKGAGKVRALLLTEKDLPSGYTKGQPGPTGSPATEADRPECAPIAAFLDERIEGATPGGSADFEGPGGTAQLSQQVFTFPDDGKAADFVRRIGPAVAKCAEFGASVGGEKMTIGVKGIDGPTVGEHSHTLNLTTEIEQLQMSFDIQVLVAVEGSVMTRLTHVPGGAADRKNFAGLAKRAGDKFVKGARG